MSTVQAHYPVKLSVNAAPSEVLLEFKYELMDRFIAEHIQHSLENV